MTKEKNWAIIDLGSNTFHLLIFQPDLDHGFKIIYRDRLFTGLAKGGQETIQKESYDRGILAVGSLYDEVKRHGVQILKVVGTSALREASNGNAFIEEVNQRFGIHIELISPEEEANFIYDGVKQCVDLSQGRFLIMDIGGGSVEFILVENGLLKWAESYKVGLGVLYNAFYHSDPISQQDQKEMESFIYQELEGVLSRLRLLNDVTLIGSSGSFEVIEEMYGLQGGQEGQIPVKFINKTYEDVILSSIDQRLKMPGLPPERADLIVVAMVLIKIITEAARPKHLKISPFAVKEGIIHQMLNI